jgi:hypothetical protein
MVKIKKIFVLTILLLLLGTNGIAFASLDPVITGSKVILYNDGNYVFLTPLKNDHDEFQRLANAGDSYGVAEMIYINRLFTVDSGTKGLVINTGFSLVRVRILSGKQAGNSGWVNREFVKLNK